MTRKKQAVIFMGLKTTGKDYNSVAYIDAGFKKIALADSLRDMLWSIIGYKPNKEFTYNEMKHSILSAEKNSKFLGFIPSVQDIAITSIRKMLQNLGTVMKDMFGENFWVNIWYKKVLEADCNIVCTDCRFPNEIKKALSLEKKGYDVNFIWVCYNKANFEEILKDTHESEQFAQYLYYNSDKYGLYDLCKINNVQMKKILKEYDKFIKMKNDIANTL